MTWSAAVEIGGIGLIALLSLIQLSPIKINPWSSIAKAIGRAINADLREQMMDLKGDIESQSSRIDSLAAEMSERTARDQRTRILRFGDELYQNTHHSKEHYDDVLADITDYENYCERHPDFKNGRTEITVRHIKSCYENCLNQHDFL